MGPSALRIAGVAEALRRMEYEVSDSGDIHVASPEVQAVGNPKLKYLEEIERALDKLFVRVLAALENKRFPLILGGDHSVAIGSVSAASAFERKSGRKVGLIWVDAHGDMNTPETTPSGNIHGISFAVCLGRGAAELVALGGEGRKIDPENAALVGVRNLDPKEQELVKNSGIHVYTMEEVDRRGIYEVMSEAVELVTRGGDRFHLSLDMDALDPETAPGVGTPVKGGLTYREAHTAMETVAASGKLASMDVVEVNPILDTRNATAELAVELIQSAMGKKIL